MIGFPAEAITSMINASIEESKAKKKKRELILEQTPESERWRVLALWEAADSIPSCRHQTNYYHQASSGGTGGIFGLGLFGIL